MAWDNPSGILSPNERDRLKREAEIFAEAQRKILREEEKRAVKQREAEERRRAAERDRECPLPGKIDTKKHTKVE